MDYFRKFILIFENISNLLITYFKYIVYIEILYRW